MMSTDVYYEPWDPACREGLFDTYQRLIHEAPVYRAPSGTWVVSSYEGVEYIYNNNHDLFSNRPNQDEAIGFPPKADFNDEESVAMMTPLAKLAEGLPLSLGDLMAAGVIAGADPPNPPRQRKIVTRGLAARRVGMFKDR